MRILYLVPKDRSPRAEFIRAIENSAIELQRWYYGQLRGRTFKLNDPVVEIRRTSHKAEWYRKNIPRRPTEKRFYAFFNAISDAERFGVRIGDPYYVWMIYLDAPGETAAAIKGIAVMPEHDLLGLAGRSVDGSPVSRWIGGSGHELGHALGLYHSGESELMSIMMKGHLTYPSCYFTAGDTAKLMKSPFIHTGAPHAIAKRGRYIYLYEGGFFVNDKEGKWLEIKTRTAKIYNYQVVDDKDGYLYIYDGSRKPGVWVMLPRKGSGGGIYFRLDGGPIRKLYAAWHKSH